MHTTDHKPKLTVKYGDKTNIEQIHNFGIFFLYLKLFLLPFFESQMLQIGFRIIFFVRRIEISDQRIYRTEKRFLEKMDVSMQV